MTEKKMMQDSAASAEKSEYSYSSELEESELEAVAGGFEIFEDAAQVVQGGGNAPEDILADVTEWFEENVQNEAEGVLEATGNEDLVGAGPQPGEPGSEENAENIPPA